LFEPVNISRERLAGLWCVLVRLPTTRLGSTGTPASTERRSWFEGIARAAAIEGNAETPGRRALAVRMHESAMRGVAAWRLVVQTRRARGSESGARIA